MDPTTKAFKNIAIKLSRLRHNWYLIIKVPMPAIDYSYTLEAGSNTPIITFKQYGLFQPINTDTIRSAFKDSKQAVIRLLTMPVFLITTVIKCFFYMIYSLANSVYNLLNGKINEAKEEFLVACNFCFQGIPYFALHIIIDTLWESLTLATRIVATLWIALNGLVYAAKRFFSSITLTRLENIMAFEKKAQRVYSEHGLADSSEHFIPFSSFKDFGGQAIKPLIIPIVCAGKTLQCLSEMLSKFISSFSHLIHNDLETASETFYSGIESFVEGIYFVVSIIFDSISELCVLASRTAGSLATSLGAGINAALSFFSTKSPEDSEEENDDIEEQDQYNQRFTAAP